MLNWMHLAFVFLSIASAQIILLPPSPPSAVFSNSFSWAALVSGTAGQVKFGRTYDNTTNTYAYTGSSSFAASLWLGSTDTNYDFLQVTWILKNNNWYVTFNIPQYRDSFPYGILSTVPAQLILFIDPMTNYMHLHGSAVGLGYVDFVWVGPNPTSPDTTFQHGSYAMLSNGWVSHVFLPLGGSTTGNGWWDTSNLGSPSSTGNSEPLDTVYVTPWFGTTFISFERTNAWQSYSYISSLDQNQGFGTFDQVYQDETSSGYIRSYASLATYPLQSVTPTNAQLNVLMGNYAILAGGYAGLLHLSLTRNGLSGSLVRDTQQINTTFYSGVTSQTNDTLSNLQVSHNHGGWNIYFVIGSQNWYGLFENNGHGIHGTFDSHVEWHACGPQ